MDEWIFIDIKVQDGSYIIWQEQICISTKLNIATYNWYANQIKL